MFRPLGNSRGIKSIKHEVKKNPILERMFETRKRGGFEQSDIRGLAKQLDWSKRDVATWVRRRKTQEEPTELTKFSETGWRVINF